MRQIYYGPRFYVRYVMRFVRSVDYCRDQASEYFQKVPVSKVLKKKRRTLLITIDLRKVFYVVISVVYISPIFLLLKQQVTTQYKFRRSYNIPSTRPDK